MTIESKSLIPRTVKTKDFRLEMKEANADGTFVGWASTYGNVDDGGDVVERGAFAEFLLTKDDRIRILYQHDSDQPMGSGAVQDTDTGLKLAGKLNLAVPYVRDAYEFMKEGVLDGLSIGFSILPGGATFDKGVRHLTKLKLWEVSVVTFGMNDRAVIDMVKAADLLPTIRDLEDHLREAGFSRLAAKAVAAGGFNALQKQRDAGAGSAQLLDLRNFLRSRVKT